LSGIATYVKPFMGAVHAQLQRVIGVRCFKQIWKVGKVGKEGKEDRLRE
jgi:hypothetical protein